MKNNVKELVFLGLVGVIIFFLGVVGVDDGFIGLDVGDVVVLLVVNILLVWGEVICIVVEVFGNITVWLIKKLLLFLGVGVMIIEIRIKEFVLKI